MNIKLKMLFLIFTNFLSNSTEVAYYNPNPSYPQYNPNPNYYNNNPNYPSHPNSNYYYVEEKK